MKWSIFREGKGLWRVLSTQRFSRRNVRIFKRENWIWLTLSCVIFILIMESSWIHCHVRKLLRNNTLCKHYTINTRQRYMKILQHQLFQQLCKQSWMTSRSALFRNPTLTLSGVRKCWRYDKFRLMIGEETNEIQENWWKLRLQDTKRWNINAWMRLNACDYLNCFCVGSPSVS